MAPRCNHLPRDLELFGFDVRQGQELGQVRCIRCHTQWSMHAKEKNVVKFVAGLKLLGLLPKGGV